jgi:hypothetical protein
MRRPYSLDGPSWDPQTLSRAAQGGVRSRRPTAGDFSPGRGTEDRESDAGPTGTHGGRGQRGHPGDPRAQWMPVSRASCSWTSLALALGIAWIAAFPVNRWLIARGLGHAKAMAHHEHDRPCLQLEVAQKMRLQEELLMPGPIAAR